MFHQILEMAFDEVWIEYFVIGEYFQRFVLIVNRLVGITHFGQNFMNSIIFKEFRPCEC